MTLANGVMMQYFHWYTAPGGLWQQVQQEANSLAQVGITALWLPPAYKGFQGVDDVGYGVYDLYDLGEFPQRETVATKYGTRAEYLGAIAALKAAQVQVYADVVLNHRMGGEGAEDFRATPYAQWDRHHALGACEEITGFTHFGFPGRQGKYSDFEWHWYHFDAVDYNHRDRDRRDAVYLIEGKSFDDEADPEFGNFDYLMGCDLDFQSPEVQAELVRWGQWYLDTTGVEGFRLDAVKHISAWFFPQWLGAMAQHRGAPLFAVGEYWSGNLKALLGYLDAVEGCMSLVDVCLHYHFHAASREGAAYDLRQIFTDTLVAHRPTQAVTFVENHDSQPLQALESPVADWFKPLAYALILLRRDGYPCLFHGDYYGATYTDKGGDGQLHTVHLQAHRPILDILLDARRRYNHGPQVDYFNHPNTIGWTRLGDDRHDPMAVVLGNGAAGYEWMAVERPHTRFRDLTGHIADPVETNGEGWGQFPCLGGSVSVWVVDRQGDSPA